MIRYEAKLDGNIESGEPYTGFNEVMVFEEILNNLGWGAFRRLKTGIGGYYQYELTIDGQLKTLHLYLKRLTFGGRENRPYEKRAQFSASLDRIGFDNQNENSLTLILAIYKREVFFDTLICAWDIKDWGQNIGRAFNCFIDIQNVAKAFIDGLTQHKTSHGQIACCFKPEWFKFYLDNRELLHSEIIAVELLKKDQSIKYEKSMITAIPKFDDLFQLIIDILRLSDQIMDVEEMELQAIKQLNLSIKDRTLIHNPQEGYRTELGYRLAWARYYLKRANLIESPKRGIWCLTINGSEIKLVDKEAIKKIATEKQIKEDLEKDLRDNIKTDLENPDIEAEENTDKTEESTDNIDNPFDPNKVDIKTRTMSMDLILKRLDRDEIEMNTSFQRKAGLWGLTQQSRLIESILIRFPLPAFYFDGSDDDKWLVVDGLQRLSALKNFAVKKITKLQNLEFLSQFNNKNFDELPKGLQRRIEEFEITAYIISPGTPKPLKYIVFKRINTGGLTLTSQEIRNALNQGRSAEFVKKLANLRSFKVATTFSIPEDRMLDREFTTRFLAFFIIPLDQYDSDLESFLNTVMEKVYAIPEAEADEIVKKFDSAMLAAWNIFGDDAFRKRYNLDDNRKPINKALFEVWSVLLSRLTEAERQLLVQRKQIIKDKFIELLNNDKELNMAISSSTSDKSRVKKRFTEIARIIHSTLD